MDKAITEKFVLIENLVQNPNSSHYVETSKVMTFIFEYFCKNNEIQASSEENDYIKFLIQSRSDSFGRFLGAMENRLGLFEGFDEWRGFCIDRSAFQFIIDLFGNDVHQLASGFSPSDLDDFDERMMQVAELEGCYPEDKIPTGVPYSHWWWSRTSP